VQAFSPTVTIRTDGAIGVTYFDFRNNTADPSTLPTDLWLARSFDAVMWREMHVSGPFDLGIAPDAEGLFLGDYHALASIGTTFLPFFVQTNSGNTANRTDVFASLVNAPLTPFVNAKSAVAESAPYAAATAAPMATGPELERRVLTTAQRVLARRLSGHGGSAQTTVAPPVSP
jgi:hypothetical protein